MKKTLVILTALLISAFSLAGTKEDYEKAILEFNKTQDQKVLEDSLIKITNNKTTDEYTIKSNIGLAELKLVQNKFGDAKLYLNKVINDKKAKVQDKIQAYTYLYQIAVANNSINDAKTAAQNVAKLGTTDAKIQSNMMLYNLNLSKPTEAKKYIEEANKLAKGEDSDILYELANFYLNNKEEAKVKEISNKLISKNDLDSKVKGHYIMVNLYMSKSDYNSLVTELETLNKITEGKELSFRVLLAQTYNTVGKEDKALEEFKKLADETKDNGIYSLVILQAEKLKNSSVVDEYYKKAKGENNKELNIYLSTVALQSDEYDTAIKYADKAINEDKINEGYLIKAYSYVGKNNKKEASAALNKAKELKVQNLEDVEKLINNMK